MAVDNCRRDTACYFLTGAFVLSKNQSVSQKPASKTFAVAQKVTKPTPTLSLNQTSDWIPIPQLHIALNTQPAGMYIQME